MLNCFSKERSAQARSVIVIVPKDYKSWLNTQKEAISNWLSATDYKAEAGKVRIVPDANGEIAYVLCCISAYDNFLSVGSLPMSLPEGDYYFDDSRAESKDHLQLYAIAWGLGAYQFTRYKKPLRKPARLAIEKTSAKEIENMVSSIWLIRDWINTPTEDMGPTEFSAVAKKVAEECGAEFSEIVGEDLLKENYASIYTVGRASDDAPRLLDLRWGDPTHPKVTLVGKGVCFDSGGLDIKSSGYMLLMKKDMAGGANALGLARMMMRAKLPVRLRVLIPTVENVISGNAYRPGDIITSRKGLTVEIGNTDAEGRVVLSDAITEAVSEKPELLIDLSTLTGAARVAVGPDIAAVFSNHDQTVNDVIKCGEKLSDSIWRLPLFNLYREYLNSSIADINNNSNEPYAGAITAALFLKDFVPDDIPWLHFDMMAWNTRTRPSKPAGGEAMAVRALFGYLEERYKE